MGGASSDNGIFTSFELSHPLNSTDINDFVLTAGNIVGLFMTLGLSTGIQPALFIAAETRVVPPIGYRQILVVEED
jgi:hypothetical protein